jgi:hypothetical protein
LGVGFFFEYFALFDFVDVFVADFHGALFDDGGEVIAEGVYFFLDDLADADFVRGGLGLFLDFGYISFVFFATIALDSWVVNTPERTFVDEFDFVGFVCRHRGNKKEYLYTLDILFLSTVRRRGRLGGFPGGRDLGHVGGMVGVVGAGLDGA